MKQGQRKSTPFDPTKGHIELMMKNFRNDRERLLFKIIVNLKLRSSDVIDLTVGQLRNKNHAKVYIKKQKIWQTILINDELKKWIKQVIKKDESDSDYIFKSRQSNGKNPFITTKTAWKWISGAAENAGLVIRDDKTGHIISEEVYSCHSGRKVFGYMANKNKETIAEIQMAYGHKNPQTTMTYLGLDQEKMDELHNKHQY